MYSLTDRCAAVAFSNTAISVKKKKKTYVTLHFNRNREKQTGGGRDVFGASFAFLEMLRGGGGVLRKARYVRLNAQLVPRG